MADPRDVLNDLDIIRAETLRRLAPLFQAQLDWRPPPTPDNSGAWSLGEIFMHIAGDELYLRELIARPLLEGYSPPASIGFVPPPPPAGVSKDAIAFWFARARAGTTELLQSWPTHADLATRHDGGLVALFGGPPQNTLEWLAGFGGHEASHHGQIDALLAQWLELAEAEKR